MVRFSPPRMPSVRKSIQLSFTSGPLLKRLELLRTCDACRKSYMLGFACHTCGIADYLERRRVATITRRCMTRACLCVAYTNDGCCGLEHQRSELRQLRDLFLSAIHTSDAITPGYQSTFYAREVARLDRMLGSGAQD